MEGIRVREEDKGASSSAAGGSESGSPELQRRPRCVRRERDERAARRVEWGLKWITVQGEGEGAASARIYTREGGGEPLGLGRFAPCLDQAKITGFVSGHRVSDCMNIYSGTRSRRHAARRTAFIVSPHLARLSNVG